MSKLRALLLYAGRGGGARRGVPPGVEPGITPLAGVAGGARLGYRASYAFARKQVRRGNAAHAHGDLPPVGAPWLYLARKRGACVPPVSWTSPPACPPNPLGIGLSGRWKRAGEFGSAAMTSDASAPRASRSGSETRQRGINLTIRLSQAERDELEADAAAAGMTLGSFVRWKLSQGQAPRSVRRPPAELEVLRQLLGQLGKCGSNLNQIAHKMNMDLSVSPRALDHAMRDVRGMRDAVLLSLGYEVSE